MGQSGETRELNAARQKRNFDFDWKFFKGDAEGAHQKDYDDSCWRDINLPHDWSIEGPFDKDSPSGVHGGFLPTGIGWYRKQFDLPESKKGSKVFITFDGVYQNCDVWINGHHIGKHAYGYSGFEYDISNRIEFGGKNVLSVRVDNSDQPNCRWYTGSGIYRHVWLTVTGSIYIKNGGVCVTTPEITHDNAVIRVRTTIKNDSEDRRTCTLITEILDFNNNIQGQMASSQTIEPNSQYEYVHDISISNPKLWSVDTPFLYEVHTMVLSDDQLADQTKTSFGVRHIRFDKEKGFFLNGQNMKKKGVCIHHDAGCLGASVPDRALERRLEILKGMGCNAIRTSHNPPAPQLLDLCDRMGFLVVDEFFDKWKGYLAPYFEEHWQEYVKYTLERDRNHPCIVLWSVGNEVDGQGTEEMKQTLKQLVDFVHQEEPTRPVTCALMPTKDINMETKVKTITEMAGIMDVLSCNYQEQWYDEYKKAYPDLVILGTESYPFFRGNEYSHKGFVPITPWFDVIKNDYVTGQFIWSGFDYLGEAQPWPNKGWVWGIIDTCGFRKPISYLQQSLWDDKPMVHIAVFDDRLEENPQKVHWNLHWSWPKMASHWNFPNFENGLVRLVTFSNCESVALFINGDLMGTKKMSDFPDHMMTWYVPYEKGTIKAVGFMNGREVCSCQLETAGEPAAIAMKADRSVVHADGQDLFHIEVEITDGQGITVPWANHLIHFELQGEGRIIGVDNGDLNSSEPYQGNWRKAFRGRCLVVIQSTRKAGMIELLASAPGLESGRIAIQSV